MTTAQTYTASFAGEVISTSERDNRGRIDAIVSAFGVAYQMGPKKHRMSVASFRGDGGIPSRVAVFWAHSWADDGGGRPPIADASVSITTRGLKMSADFDLTDPEARRVYNGYKSGALTQWSVGYIIRDYREADGGRTWDITRAELLEASAVLKGANPGTLTDQVAAASAGASVDLDDIARKVGMPTDADALSSLRKRNKARAAETAGDMSSVCTSMVQVHAQVRSMQSGDGGALEMASELAWAWLAATGHPLIFHPEFGGRISYAPVPEGIPDLVVPILHTEGMVKAPMVGRTDASDPIPYGTDAHDVALTATGAPQKMARFAVSDEEDSDVLTDAGRGVEAVLRTGRLGLRTVLANATINANGSIDDYEGGLNVAGQQLNASGLSGVQVLSRSARLVHEAGFSGPLALVGHPTTVDLIFLGRSVREEVPSIVAYIPTHQMPLGSCLVADWQAALDLYMGPVMITSTRSDKTNFRLSRTVFLFEVRAAAAWQQPTAIVEVINVASS